MPSDPLVLIVDDDENLLTISEVRLKASGYQIEKANNGLIALETVKRRRPDLIILDVMMPIMDGFSVCKQLKSDDDFKDIPIIFLSARDEESDIKFGYSLGAEAYLTKPYDGNELLENVNRLIQDHATKENTYS